MIAVVQPAPERGRKVWAFWAACGLAAAGAVTPLLLAGTSGRAAGVIFPFGFAAIALAGCGWLEHRGRFLATALYLVAGLAIVYGILGMFGLLIQMTVMSPCPAAPEPCGIGFARPLTPSESTGINFAMGLGFLAIVIGFAGLVANYRQHRAQPTSFTPPVRRVPPQPAHQSQPETAPQDTTPPTTEGASD